MDIGSVYMGQYRMGRQMAGVNRLIVMHHGQLQEYDLNRFGKERILFGRDPAQCDIVISSALVSACHGRIKLADGQVLVGDTGSTNGIYYYVENQYQRMESMKYYVKSTGDWILWIDSRDRRQEEAVVLIFTSSTDKSVWKQLPIGNQPISIGRDPRNTVVMESASFSKCHAVIARTMDGRYTVHDQNTMNGVYVNGQRILGQAVFQDKDLLQIAGSLFLVMRGILMYQSGIHGVSLRLQNVSKTVGRGNNQKKILNHVFCDIGSNEFVAIIGGSGAGKTTVMNAMSGFDAEITGKVFCNGIDLHANFNSLKNMIGFVPQQDIIYENLTLWKMLYYTAKMKMPSDTSGAEMERRIHRVLKMVDLQERADTFIRKLSGGQKKRASIAVEMLADPGLFFLDEPTSGLDPDTEQSLMHTLSQLAKNEGKTIIMVTHTTQSIHLCDKVIFMGPGGKICYCGSPQNITDYFQKKSLVDVYNELAGNCDRWNRIYLQQYMQERGQQPEPPVHIRKPSKQVSSGQQLMVLISRYFALIWNDKQRLMLLLLQPVGIASLLCIVASEDAFRYWSDTRAILFALACSGIWIGLFNTIQEICKERAILKREYMGNLRLWIYILSKFIVQGLVCLLQSAILSAIFLLAMEHNPKSAAWMPTPQLEIWVTLLLVIFASAAMGLIVSALVKNGDRAMAIAPFVLIVQLLFAGVIFDLEGASDKISYLTVSRWAMEGMGNTARLNKLKAGIPGMIVEKSDMYKRSAGHLFQTWGILLAIAVSCGIISALVLQNLKKDNR